MSAAPSKYDWQSTRLGDLVSIKYGKMLPTKELSETGFPVFGANGIIGCHTKYLYEDEQVLISCRGAYSGKINLSPPHCYVTNNSLVLEIPSHPKITKRFLYYGLQAIDRSRMVTGSAQPQVTINNAVILEIPVPPISEQDRIVAEIEKHFTRLDAGIAALSRVQAKLKRYCAAVLKAACEGKLVENEVGRQKKKRGKVETGEKLLTRILAERRISWAGRGKYKVPVPPNTANLPQLPVGWAWATIEQLAAPEPNAITDGPFGSNLKTEHYKDTGPRVIRLQNIGDGIYVDEEAHISLVHFERLQKHRIFAGDVVIAGFGENPPRSCIIPDSLGPAIVKADCIRFKPHRSIMSKYVNSALNSDPVRKRTKGMVHGVGRPRLNLGEIKSIVLPLPPLAEQKRIVAEVERRLSIIEELESEVSANLQRATRLRQSILHKAFSGELVAREVTTQPNEVIKLPTVHIRRPNRHFARALLSAEIVHRLHKEPTFGRIKHQKIFHLCEHIAQIKEIDGQYHREVAGPLDNKLIYANEAELKKQKWYCELKRGSYGHSYEPMDKAGAHQKYVEDYWPEKLPVVQKLVEMMRSWDTDRCEIFCTAYAAWNDIIIWGKEPTEAAILHEILVCWNDSKKRFAAERWIKAVKWMKEKGYAPTGFGRSTKATK